MRQLFALSAIGRDRPGIVADLAELIYECDCNLEDSRMTLLGSEFAVLLLLSGQGADVAQRLSTACKRLEWAKRLTIFLRPLDGDASSTDEPAGRVLECSVTGVDKAGIVARIARTIADQGANVQDLRSELRRQPESGTPIYTMRLVMRLGHGVDERTLRRRLDEDGAALGVDVVVGELPGDR